MCKFFCAVVFLLLSSSSLMGQDIQFTWGPVVGRTQGWNTCAISKTAQDLRDRLTQFGWTAQPNAFPKIDWKNKMALVVTARDQYAQPIRVAPPTLEGDSVVYLQADAKLPNSGVVILEVANTTTIKKCAVNYAGFQTDADTSKHGGSQTVQGKP